MVFFKKILVQMCLSIFYAYERCANVCLQIFYEHIYNAV